MYVSNTRCNIPTVFYSSIIWFLVYKIVWQSKMQLASKAESQHTYLAQEIPWSIRRFSQGEAFPLHSGWADPCDHPKCGWLGCAIFVRGGLRSRYPLINNQSLLQRLVLESLPCMLSDVFSFVTVNQTLLSQEITSVIQQNFNSLCLLNSMVFNAILLDSNDIYSSNL